MRPVFRRPRASSPRVATPVLLRDPARLHGILDRVLAPREGPPDAFHAVAKSAVEMFDPLRSELGLVAVAVYAEDGPSLRLQQRVGGEEGQFATVVDLETARHLLLPGRHARVYADPADALSPAALGLAPLGPSAVRVVEAASVRHLLVAVLTDTTDPALAEFVLGVVGSVVSAHALRERWRQSLDEAEEIQRELLPASIPDIPGFEVAARSVPAEVVGGDFYDFHELGGTTGVVVGDAVGHGLSAALVARDVVVGLRVALDRRRPAPGVLARLNRVLRAGLPGRAFASLFYVEVHPDGRFEYVSAGHPPALCVTASSRRALRRGGPVLGPFEQVSFRRTRGRLRVGEMLVLYTDGIVERRNLQGETFAEHRLADVVASCADAPVQDILDRVFAQAMEFGNGPWSDDATVVILRRTSPAPSPSTASPAAASPAASPGTEPSSAPSTSAGATGKRRRSTAAASGRSQDVPPSARDQPRP